MRASAVAVILAGGEEIGEPSMMMNSVSIAGVCAAARFQHLSHWSDVDLSGCYKGRSRASHRLILRLPVHSSIGAPVRKLSACLIASRSSSALRSGSRPTRGFAHERARRACSRRA